MLLQQQAYLTNTLFMYLDALMILVAGIIAHYAKYLQSGQRWSMEASLFSISVLLVIIVNNYVMGKLGLYSDTRPASGLKVLWTVAQSLFFDFAILSTAIVLFRYRNFSRVFLGSFAVCCFVLIVFERILLLWLLRQRFRKNFHASRIVIVGDSERGEIVAGLLKSQLSWGHQIVGRVTLDPQEIGSDAVLGGLDDLPRLLMEQPVDDVVFAVRSGDSLDLRHYLDLCKQMGIPVKILPSLWNPGEHIPVSSERYQGVPFLVVQRGRFNATGLLYKRILDLIGGLVGGLLFLLMYPLVAVAIKLDSPGPVLFRQKRVGQNGRIFTLYKFRSMYIDAEERKLELQQQNEMQGAMFKLRDDPRITRVGRWLRKSSVDEFPQFLNVLKGEMSLVGTRPPTPDEVAHYETFHRRRISAKPGITGLWQVSGRNRIKDFDKVVELDCQYLDHWRFLDDLYILLKTIWVVLKRKGAV